MKNKRVLLVSYHFYPDSAIGARRISELAAHLRADGHEVTVVSAGGEPIQTDPALNARVQGMRIHRVAVPPKLTPRLLGLLRRRRNAADSAAAGVAASESNAQTIAASAEGLLARIKRYYHALEWLVDDHKLWSLRAALRIARLALRERFDWVISSGPPMSPHLAVLAARPLLRCRWIMDMRDPWTDDQEWLRHVRCAATDRINAFLERRCIAAADVVTTTTPSLARLLKTRYPERDEAIQCIYNGYDGAPERSPPPLGELRLLYAGSIYYNRDPFPLLRAVAELVARPEVERRKVSFLLVGNCQQWRGSSVSEWIRAHQLEDCIEVRAPVAASEVARLMREANVLVNFAQGQPRQIPAKMFEYIASRRQMLLIAEADSDSAALVRDTGSGWICDPRAPESLPAALQALYRQYVVEAHGYDADPGRVALFARASQNRRFLEILGSAPLAVSETPV